MKWVRVLVLMLVMPGYLKSVWVHEYGKYNKYGVQLKWEGDINLDLLFNTVINDNLNGFKNLIRDSGLTNVSVICPRGYPHVLGGIGYQQFTLLQLAAYFNAVEIMAWLIDRGWDTNGVANEYLTAPLHFWARGDAGGARARSLLIVPRGTTYTKDEIMVLTKGARNLEGVLLLLEKGARPGQRNFWRKSFVDELLGDRYEGRLTKAGLALMVKSLQNTADRQRMILAIMQAEIPVAMPVEVVVGTPVERDTKAVVPVATCVPSGSAIEEPPGVIEGQEGQMAQGFNGGGNDNESVIAVDGDASEYAEMMRLLEVLERFGL